MMNKKGECWKISLLILFMNNGKWMNRRKKDHGWNNGDFDELLSYKSVCLIKYEDKVVSEDRSVLNEQTEVQE